MKFTIGRNDAYCFSFGLQRNRGNWLIGFIFDGGVGSSYGIAKLGICSASSAQTPSGRWVSTKTIYFKLPFQKFFKQIGHNRFMRLFPR